MAEKNEHKDSAPKSAGAPKTPKPTTAAPSAPRPQGGRPQIAPQTLPLSASGKEIRGIVRMAGKDLKGQWTLPRSIRSIRGIGVNLGQVMARTILQTLKVGPETMVGELEEPQVRKVEEILSHPEKFGVPSYMLNRQREFQTNETHHLIATDLGFAVKTDIEHEKDSYTWRGYRHAYGQKVRGQHTRSTGRSGMTVGVLRKAVIAKAGAAAGATGAGAQAAAQATDKGKAAGAAGAAAAPKGAAAPKAEKAAPAAKPAEAKK